MLDLLTPDRNGRLTILELKADEDLHLPLRALDYWIRVHALDNQRKSIAGIEGGRPLSSFERQGYSQVPRFRRLPRACCWRLRLCAFIPQMQRCCAIFLPRWSGS